MPIEERWVRNGAVRLHCLEQESDSALTPFLIVPGTFGVAEDYVQVMEALAPRRCIGVSLHGRGRSDAPQSGYRFEDHVDDIAAAAAQLANQRFAIMGYSMGAACARICRAAGAQDRGGYRRRLPGALSRALREVGGASSGEHAGARAS